MAEPTGPLARMARLNRTAVFLVTIGVLLLALFLPGWYGAALLFVIALGLVALLRLTWHMQSPGPRLLRLLVIVAMLVAAIAKVV